MTDTLLRPPSSSESSGAPPDPGSGRPAWGLSSPATALLLAGLRAAGQAATVGLVAVCLPVLLLWVADGAATGGPGDALRTGAQIWLLAHGAPLQLPGAVVGLVPLGLLALPVALLVRAGAQAARRCAPAPTGTGMGPVDAARTAVAVALPYAVLVAAVAAAARTEQVVPGATRAVLGATGLGLAACAVGVVRGAGLAGRLEGAVPLRLRRALLGGAGAATMLFGAGTLVTAAALALSAGQAAALQEQVAAGVSGGLAVLLLGLLLLPTAGVWGACWLAGPGVALGTGTAFGPLAVTAGPQIPLPLLAALPAAPAPPALAVLALSVPVLCGALAGRLVRCAGGDLRDVAAAAAVGGLLLTGAAALTAGRLGTGRLADVGPDPLAVGAAVAAELLAGALLAELTAVAAPRAELLLRRAVGRGAAG